MSTPGPHRLGHTGSSEAVENYAKAIYALSQRASDGAVTTNDVAHRMGVTAASASAMVRKLAELGLATHAPYRGVELSEEGQRLALEVLRHHRLLELYLAEHLGVPWDRVHEEAEALEHVLSADLEQRIAAKLGHPTHDPHGDPIPDADLVVHELPTRPLTALAVGESGVFVRVSDTDPEMLRYLSARGIAIGKEVYVTGREPFGGPLRVSVAQGEHALGPDLAAAMRVA